MHPVKTHFPMDWQVKHSLPQFLADGTVLHQIAVSLDFVHELLNVHLILYRSQNVAI